MLIFYVIYNIVLCRRFLLTYPNRNHMLTMESLALDTSKTVEKIEKFISSEVKKAGLKGAVVAVSGGIDSAVTLALTVKALGSNNVKAVTMPERDITSEGDITDVIRLTDMYDVTCDTVDITPVIRAIEKTLPLYDVSDLVPSGNIKPRLRMIVAYHYANARNLMVIGSSNKTEWLTGYFTKHGDGGVDILPFADLYKCQVRQLAKHLGLPQNIIDKAPSAGLWLGQTDEGEIGASYDTLDLVLHGDECGHSDREIAEQLGVELELVRRILDRVESNEHKRRPPLILRLSDVTV
jgi:NAD+ synthase